MFVWFLWWCYFHVIMETQAKWKDSLTIIMIVINDMINKLLSFLFYKNKRHQKSSLTLMTFIFNTIWNNVAYRVKIFNEGLGKSKEKTLGCTCLFKQKPKSVM